MSKPIWRSAKKRETYTTSSHPTGTYSVFVTLTCGHTKRYKGSEEPKKLEKLRCRECEWERDGIRTAGT